LARPWSKQYRSIIFFHNEEQKRLALETKARLEEKVRKRVYTEIEPAAEFYQAEDYHQKYYLRNSRELMEIFKEIYTSDDDFVASTAAALMNGYVGGYRIRTGLDKALQEAGLSPEFAQRIVSITQSAKR
jgi:peptide-methionine (S)-S-oxide reductase